MTMHTRKLFRQTRLKPGFAIWVVGLLTTSGLLVSAGCGKKDSDSSAGSDENAAPVPILERPMVASVGVGGPPRGNNEQERPETRPADAITPPEVPSALKIPESPVALSFRPANRSGARYESLVIRELEHQDGTMFSRKDFLELSLACEADEEQVDANITTERVYVHYEGPQGSTEFDTMNAIAYSGQLARALAPTLQSLVEEQIQGTVDRRGQFIDVHLPAGFRDEISSNPDVERFGFAEPFVRDIACQLAVPLPTDPVKVGDEWESDSGWSRFGKDIKLHSNYRLEGLAERDEIECAVISFETLISGATNQDTVFKEMSYSLTGVAYVARDSGELLFMTNEANGETTVEMEDSELTTFQLRFRTRIQRVAS